MITLQQFNVLYLDTILLLIPRSADVHSDVHVPFYLDFLFGEFVFAFCSSNKIILGVQTETIFIMLTICQSPF